MTPRSTLRRPRHGRAKKVLRAANLALPERGSPAADRLYAIPSPISETDAAHRRHIGRNPFFVFLADAANRWAKLGIPAGFSPRRSV